MKRTSVRRKTARRARAPGRSCAALVLLAALSVGGAPFARAEEAAEAAPRTAVRESADGTAAPAASVEPDGTAVPGGPGTDAVLSLADSLLSAGEPDAAITEYKRFLFLHPGEPRAWRARERIASCYRSLGQWRSSIAWYEQASGTAPQPAAQVEAELAAAAVELASSSFTAAEYRLLSLGSAFPAELLAGRDMLYLGLVHLLMDRPREAEEEIAAYAALLEPDARQAVESVLSESRGARRVSPSTARLLSTLLPGAGQAYAGNALDGMDALAVNGASAGLVVWCLLSGNYPEAALAFSYLFKRYYKGNRENADKQAAGRNARINRRIAAELLDAIAASSAPHER